MRHKGLTVGSKPALTIGMACYDDFAGAWMTLQSLRLHHAEVMPRCELIVVDNGPKTRSAPRLKNLIEGWIGPHARARYVPMEEPVGTSPPRDRVFTEAVGDTVLCLDSHVMLQPGAIRRLLDYYDANPGCDDLLSGPMLYDDLLSGGVATHFQDVWRAEMWGIWGHDARGEDPDGEPFEIGAMGLGLFSCRKAAWPGFHPYACGFGGEEWYIHEKFRQLSRRCLCLPGLRWLHRYSRPTGMRYPVTQWHKVRNYMLELQELGLSLDRLYGHFVEGVIEIPLDGSEGAGPNFLMTPEQWDYLLADPVGHATWPGFKRWRESACP